MTAEYPRVWYAGTRIDEPPTLAGTAGRAWQFRLPAPGQRERPEHDGTVGSFMLHVPGAHVAWDHWAATLMHLRPIPGVRPPHRQFPAATHEFIIMALDPGQPLPPLDYTPAFRLAFLRPIDVVQQVTAADDAVAYEILELAVRHIVDGFASPDQDWRPWWKQALETTAQHFADGTHPMRRPS